MSSMHPGGQHIKRKRAREIVSSKKKKGKEKGGQAKYTMRKMRAYMFDIEAIVASVSIRQLLLWKKSGTRKDCKNQRLVDILYQQ